jgi:hypothetical protein
VSTFAYLLARWLVRPGERLEDLPAEKAAHQLISSVERWSSLLGITEEDLDRIGVFDQPLSLVPSAVNREEWWRLVPLLAEESESRTMEQRRKRFQRAIREKLVDRWLDEHTSIAKEAFQRTRVQTEVERLVASDDIEEAVTYLRDVITLGVKKADRKGSMEGWGIGAGTLWGHAWTALLGVARLLIALGLLSIAQSKFESVVFAMLILTYNLIDGAFQNIGHSLLVGTIRTDNRLSRLAQFGAANELYKEREEPTESTRKVDQDFAASTTRLFIRSVFVGLTSLIAIVVLIKSIFGM